MPRPARTPYLDEWRARLREDLAVYGARARLARFLEANLGLAGQTARNRVSLMLDGDYVPSGETVLAVEDWRRSRG